MPRRTLLDLEFVKVGARIRAVRRGRGVSLDQLAARCGIAKGSLSNIEHGRVNVTLRTLLRLAAGLEVDVLEFFCFPEENVKHAGVLRVLATPDEVEAPA